jgi:hypothetical protein
MDSIEPQAVFSSSIYLTTLSLLGWIFLVCIRILLGRNPNLNPTNVFQGFLILYVICSNIFVVVSKKKTHFFFQILPHFEKILELENKKIGSSHHMFSKWRRLSKWQNNWFSNLIQRVLNIFELFSYLS